MTKGGCDGGFEIEIGNGERGIKEKGGDTVGSWGRQWLVVEERRQLERFGVMGSF